MKAERRRAASALCALLVGGAVLLLPATSVAGSQADSDLQDLIEALRDFDDQVENDRLTEAGIEEQAREMIRLKRRFIENTHPDNGTSEFDLTYYFPLKKIDNKLEDTARNADRRKRAMENLEDARARTDELHEELSDKGEAYDAAADCMRRLVRAQGRLLEDMELDPETGEPHASPADIKRRANNLESRKLTCVSYFPQAWGESYHSIYRSLSYIDEQMDKIADPNDETESKVRTHIGNAREEARRLRRIVVEWDSRPGSPSGTATSTSSATPTATSTTTTPGSSPTSTSSPSPSATPTSTSSPSDNLPPNVSGIGATFDSQRHATDYEVSATDQDGDPITYAWSKSNERQCGEFTSNGNTATWNHAHPPCPAEQTHPGTITVVVSDGHYDCIATYSGGSAPGTGFPPECTPK